MFPNEVMMKQQTWSDILSAMIAVRDAHGWREDGAINVRPARGTDAVVVTRPAKSAMVKRDAKPPRKIAKPAAKTAARKPARKAPRVKTKKPVRKAKKPAKKGKRR